MYFISLDAILYKVNQQIRVLKEWINSLTMDKQEEDNGYYVIGGRRKRNYYLKFHEI